MNPPNIDQKAPNRAGYSDWRIRFFVLTCLVVVILLTPLFGLLWSSLVVTMFAFFLAVKRALFEQTDLKSIYRYGQAMDRMYHNSVNAQYYELALQPFEATPKSKPIAKVSDAPKPSRFEPGLRPVIVG